MTAAKWRKVIEDDMADKRNARALAREEMGYKDRVVPMHPKTYNLLIRYGSGSLELGCARAAQLAQVCGLDDPIEAEGLD